MNKLKYGIKNKTERQLEVSCNSNPTTDEIFLIPPHGLRNVLLTTEEYNFISKTYDTELIVRKLA